MNTKEIAKLAGVCTQTVRRMARDEEINCQFIGGPRGFEFKDPELAVKQIMEVLHKRGLKRFLR